MKRRIVFRGYNLKNKKWLYGYYLVNRGKSYIVQDEVVNPFAEESDFEVDPESVGQYVGEYEGKPIYEGDIVLVESTEDNDFNYEGVVKYDIMECRYFAFKSKENPSAYRIPISGKAQVCANGIHINYIHYYKYKVIGNEYEEKLKISNP